MSRRSLWPSFLGNTLPLEGSHPTWRARARCMHVCLDVSGLRCVGHPVFPVARSQDATRRAEQRGWRH